MTDVEHSYMAIGKRAIAGLRKSPHPTVKSYFDVFGELSYVLAGEICDQLVGLYQSSDPAQRIDEAYIVYNEFASVIQQNPIVKKLLPVDYKTLVEERREELKAECDKPRPIYEIEPNVEAVMDRLVSRRLATEVYRATLESYAAELAARMTAMDNATNNAEDMIGSLTLTYNRARQAGITGDLLDIVGGANALNG